MNYVDFKVFNVFNVEFDGIDKCGKDSIMRQIFSVAPNKFIPKARGLISQIAFAKMFNRNYIYNFSNGYVENTLFVYLTVDEADWKVRCELTNEHEINKKRSDVEGEIKYKSSIDAFDYAYNFVKAKAGINYEKHFMKFNTSMITPISIIHSVVDRLNELNS